jgi:hypothetical protein
MVSIKSQYTYQQGNETYGLRLFASFLFIQSERSDIFSPFLALSFGVGRRHVVQDG